MRIGMILERDFPTTPPDIRVEKEARSLLRAGHEVDMLSLKITSSEDRCWTEGIQVFRIPIPMLRIRDWEEDAVERHFHSPGSPWVTAIADFVEKRRPDAIHVHDLPLVWSAGHVARKKGLPLVFDMHEVYPPMVRFMRNGEAGSWDTAEWVAGYEMECVQMADRIIVVVEESRERLLRMGVPGEKIAVVMNTEDPEKMKPTNATPSAYKHLSCKFLVTYVGTFGEIRGLETLIEAAQRVFRQIPIHLLLVGGAYNQLDLEALARNIGVETHVTITGWVAFETIPDLIAMSDVCVAPHVKNAFTDATIPHKLFQYMLMGKPVIVSDANPLARIVRECNCGLVFPSGDPEALAGALLQLHGSEGEGERLGCRGLKAALAKYNWHTDEKNLLNLYAWLGRKNAHA